MYLDNNQNLNMQALTVLFFTNYWLQILWNDNMGKGIWLMLAEYHVSIYGSSTCFVVIAKC